MLKRKQKHTFIPVLIIAETVGIHTMMKSKIITLKHSGVLYLDEEITCIKDEQRVLNIHRNNANFDLITSKQLANRTNKIGRYVDGIFFFEDKKTYFLDLNGKINSIAEGEFFYRHDESYVAKTSFDTKGFISFTGSVNAKVEILRNGGDKLFLDSKFIQVSDSRNSEITCNDLQRNGEVLWKIDLKEITDSDKAFIHSKIIVYGNSLYTVCDGQENRGLFQFDLETGEIKNKLDKFYEIYQERDFIYTSKFPNVLCRIDCKNNSIEEWNVDDLLKENNFDSIHDHRCDVRNEKYYFTQSLGDNKAKFGVLDFQNKKLIYKHDFVPENGAIGSIRTSDLRTFIHTQDGQLHIFE